MHLQENTLYDLDLVVKVTQNVVQCPPNHMTYAPAKFEVATSNSLGVDESNLYDLDLGVKVTQNVAQYHPHHVTYAPVKLLCPMVQEKIHLQENTLFDLGVFDLDPKVKVT